MLIGRGALANYHDVPAAHAGDFNHWHGSEHLPERVGIPGFLRGRRARAIAGSPEYFILYETTDVSVLRSPQYLARLNAPTPWTARVSACMTRTVRTAARVRASAGVALGGVLLAARLAPPDGELAALGAALSEGAAADLAGSPGLCGVHVLEADAQVTAVPTAERGLRGPPDETSPWMVLIEGCDREPVEGAWSRLRPRLPAATRDGAEAGTYAVQAVFALCDL